MRLASNIDRPAELPGKLAKNELTAFIDLANRLTGIQLDVSKEKLLYTRLIRRLRALKMPSFRVYLELLNSGDEREVEEFINAVTTNLTYFFREPHHFEFLKKAAIPDLLSSSRRSGPIRLWSAACSSGEEAYSMAIILAESGLTGGSDYRLLCTDLNTEMVDLTRQGLFKTHDARGLDSGRKSNYFTERQPGYIEAKSELTSSLICKPLNLFSKWPIHFGVDVIFCRNVLIYFNTDQHKELIFKFARIQAPGAYLFLGHSESVRGAEDYYVRVGNTVFQRTKVKVH